MTPRADEYEQDSIDDDDDDGLKEDMAALSRACMLNDDEIQSQEDPLLATGDAIVPFTVTADSDSDEQSDLECLKRVQSLYHPNNGTLPPPQPTTAAFDDDEDDFETVRAIFKRFSAYDGGRLHMNCYLEFVT
jgi:myb proto-oncogene protein